MTTPVWSAEKLVELTRVTAFAVSPCGTWAAVAASRLDADGAKYLSDLWKLPFDGSPAKRLTHTDSDDSAPSFRRDGALGFLSNRRPSDKPGDRKQVWLFDPRGGEPEALTDEPLGVSAFRFASDAPVLVCVAAVLPGVEPARQREVADDRKKNGPTLRRYTRTPVRYWDHWLPEAAAHVIGYVDDGTGRRDLTPLATREHQLEFEFAVDPAGRFVVATSARPSADRIDDVDFVRIPLDGGEAVHLVGADHVAHASPVLSLDGRWLAGTRTARSTTAHGPVALVLTDTETGQTRRLKGLDRWLVPQCFSLDGRALFAVADDHGHTPIFRVDLETGAVERVTHVNSGGHHAGVALVPKFGRLATLRDTFFHPPELATLEPYCGSVPKLVSTLSGFDMSLGHELAAAESVEAVVDGRAIQSWLLRPAQEHAPGPGLVWVHGGPHGQWTDSWHWRWNPLVVVSAGYTVLMPNPAGSTGFGQDLVEAVFGNAWGAQCFRDVMGAVDLLAGRDDVDAGRLALMGGSFGGYMTNWVGTQTDRFAALVSHAGLFDFSTFAGTTDSPAWFMNDFGGLDAERDRVALERYSPRSHVDGWKTPVLILHGERDYRVPVSEALVMFDALERRGVDVELGVFPDENHWIIRPRNTVAWYGVTLEFLGKRLGTTSPS